MSRTPSWSEVIRRGVTAALEGVHTAIPGKVTRYDAATQKADVQPLIRAAYEDENGERVAASLPVVTNCPVQFGGGAGLTITYPLAVGDTGLLVFSEGSLDKWLAGRGGEVDPGIDTRFALADGIFIPGVKPFGAARATNPGAAVCIGTDGGAFQGAALGAALAEWLGSPNGNPLTELLAWAKNHVHPAPGTAPPVTPPPDAPTLESTTVKITP